MRRALLTVCLVSLVPAAAVAQSHTIVALSHTDHTAYEVDPASGKILHQFTAVDQPHEGVASADGKTFYAAIPNGPHVVILDATPLEVAGTVTIGRGPGFPIFSPDSGKLYVMNSGAGDVCVIDLKDMKSSARHKVGVNPFGGGLRFPGGRPTTQD